MKRNPIALGIVLVVGLVMAIGSLVISLPAKTQGVDNLTTDFRPAFQQLNSGCGATRSTRSRERLLTSKPPMTRECVAKNRNAHSSVRQPIPSGCKSFEGARGEDSLRRAKSGEALENSPPVAAVELAGLIEQLFRP